MYSTSFKISSECSICNNSFDSYHHRPRVLPCGHGFCTSCMQSCINRGNNTCSVCRKVHGAKSANDLPVCFLLEESLKNATVSAPHIPVPVPAQSGTIVMCPKHLVVPLYFHCKTHKIEICHSCAVLDHPPTLCSLIFIEDKIKEMKKTEVETVQKGKKELIETEKDLNRLNQDLEKQVQSLLTKIEQTNQEIAKINRSKERIKDAIIICQKNQKTMDTLEFALNAASNQVFSQTCDKTASEITKIKKWEVELRKELKIKNKYAQVHRNGIVRSSEIILEGGRRIIPSLSKAVKPETSAILLKEAELGLTSANTKVFLEFSAKQCHLGRVIINVHGDKPYGQNFIMLACGSEGPTLKNATPCMKDHECIIFNKYVTETGSRSNKALTSLQGRVHSSAASRGRLFTNGNTDFFFFIITKHISTNYSGYFGDILVGMDVIDRAYSSEFNIEDIHISNSGIILETH